MSKILLSAYACEPNKGSEPEVGWQWAVNIAKKHEVWILTKENNSKTIEEYRKTSPYEIPWDNMHFVYVHLPKWLVFWKRGNRGIRLYYYLWAKKAYVISKELQKKEKFDIVHSVTFVSLTQPCFLYKLEAPFVWTVAGGENISKVIGYKMAFKEKLYEFIRDIGQLKAKHSHRIRVAIKKSSLILATTEETARLIPKEYHDKVVITSAIGIDKVRPIKKQSNNGEVKVLLSGKFVYLKGVRLGIDAILKIIDRYDKIQFTILGNGPYKNEYKQKCEKYIGGKIRFVDRVPHEKIAEFYREHDFLINTALRDSGCLVAMEAMSIGLPIVCLNSGGVKCMTEEAYAVKVDPKPYSILVDEMAKGIAFLIENKEKRMEMGRLAYEHINEEYLYSNKCEWLLEQYKKILGHNYCEKICKNIVIL